MFLVEPAPTRGDFHFRVFGVSVRIHPFFWLIALLLGMNLHDGALLILWILVDLVSILVHEFGHVLAFRRFGARARVVLYAFGGLAIADRDSHRADWGRDWRPPGAEPEIQDGWRQIIISFAGPLAGFALAAMIAGALFATGYRSSVPVGPWNVPIGVGGFIANERLANAVYFLLQVNILWGLINLLPIYPLDGGHIARELLLMLDHRTGIGRSLLLSAAAAAAIAVGMLVLMRGDGLFAVLMFGSLAYSSYTTYRAYQAMGGYGGGYDGGRDW